MTEAASNVVENVDRLDDPSLEDRVRNALEGAPDEGGRMALMQLSTDQARMIVQLMDGFDSRQDILRWMQDLTIQSLGHLEDDWFATVTASPGTVSALLGRPWGPIPEISPVTAKEIRRSIAARELLPAYQRAIAEFRWAAKERTEIDDIDQSSIDPFNQKHPAMRPNLTHQDKKHGWALDRLLEGFDNEDEVLLWANYVTSSTYAEIDGETISGAYFDKPIRQSMTDRGSPIARFKREAWAAKYLLPAFNRATHAVAKRSQEVISTARTDRRGPPPG